METKELNIRKINSSDCLSLISFFEENDNALVTKYFHPFPLNHSVAYSIAVEPSKDRFYIAELHEVFVGFYMLRGWDEGFETPSFGIFVDHRYQGRGLGRIITEAAIEEARRLKCPAIRLSVFSKNIHALKIYRSLGFKETSREKGENTVELGQKIIMQKILQGK